MAHIPIRTLGTAAFLALLGLTHASRSTTRLPREISAAIDAPYRDGTFVGRLAAERCDSPPAPIGRWSVSAERSRFSEGYRDGFSVATRSNAACTTTREAARAER